MQATQQPEEPKEMSLISTQAAAYAAQVATRYAWSVEPGLSAEEEEDLREALSATLRRVMTAHTAPERIEALRIEALNRTLDDWEKIHRKSGPRIDALDGDRVTMSQRG